MRCGWAHVVHRIGEGNGCHFVVVVVVVVVEVEVVVEVVVGAVDGRCSCVLPEASGVLGDGRIHRT